MDASQNDYEVQSSQMIFRKKKKKDRMRMKKKEGEKRFLKDPQRKYICMHVY